MNGMPDVTWPQVVLGSVIAFCTLAWFAMMMLDLSGSLGTLISAIAERIRKGTKE